MPYTIKLQSFPNNERRATMYLQRSREESDRADAPGGDIPESGSPPALLPLTGTEGHESPSLDISSKLRRVGFGRMGKRTKFGSNAKNTLLRAGGAADKVAPEKGEWLFLTGTQPSGTEESFRTLAEWSSYCVDALKSWINWYAKTTYSFYVWEHQKRGALHLHYAVHVPDAIARRKLLDGFKEEWKRILDSVQQKSGIDMWKRKDGTYHKNGWHVLQAYAQTVKKGVAAYLSKYCSKGANSEYQTKKFGFHPARWWGVSRPLKQQLDALTETTLLEGMSFTTARVWMQKWYRRTLDQTHLVYSYLHKVGTGQTVVSYHPYNQEEPECQMNKIQVFSPRIFPGTCSLIREILWIFRKFQHHFASYKGTLSGHTKNLSDRINERIAMHSGVGLLLFKSDLLVVERLYSYSSFTSVPRGFSPNEWDRAVHSMKRILTCPALSFTGKADSLNLKIDLLW